MHVTYLGSLLNNSLGLRTAELSPDLPAHLHPTQTHPTNQTVLPSQAMIRSGKQLAPGASTRSPPRVVHDPSIDLLLINLETYRSQPSSLRKELVLQRHS